MILYPWLKKYYKIIIQKHKKKQMHHAILLQSEKGIGLKNLIKNIIIKIMNNKNIKKKNIKKYLFNNPDIIYNIYNKKKKKINIKIVRKIKEKIYITNHKEKYKIIWLPNAKKINEQATNALLKILEEPPKNTIFFMTNNFNNKLKSTIRSRFTIYNIIQPIEKESIIWLKKKFPKEKKILLAIKLNYGSPILAKKFIKKNIFYKRNIFLKNFNKCIKIKNFLIILPYFENLNTIYLINWIYSIFLDSLKYKFKIYKNLINLDQLHIIKIINLNYSYSSLFKGINICIKLKKYIINIPTINKELIITKYLLKLNNI